MSEKRKGIPPEPPPGPPTRPVPEKQQPSRIHPTVQDQKDAAALRWFDEHPDAVMHVGNGMWCVLETETPRQEDVFVKGLCAALRMARAVQEKKG